jgi:hypothetical protein
LGRIRTKEHCENISKGLKGNIPWNKNTVGLQKSHRKGLSQVEEYGEEKADILKKINSETSKKYWKNNKEKHTIQFNKKHEERGVSEPWLKYNRRIKIKEQTDNDGNVICEKCNNVIIGYKKIQCHHIDGDHKNNKLENLMILCPKCHFPETNVPRDNKGRFRCKKD